MTEKNALQKTDGRTYSTFKALLYDDHIQQQLYLVKPRWFSIDRLLRVVLSQATKNPLIYKCSQESILRALMACSQLGLEPIMGRAYLIPYHNSKKINGQWIKVWECNFQTGFQGLIDLARRSGTIKDVTGKVVYENDFFDYSFGTERKIEHKPVLTGDRGKPIAAYAVWYMAGGEVHPEIMSIDEIYKRRDVSQAYQRAISNPDDKNAQKTPWILWPEDMMIKTIIRYSSKQVPASIDFMQAVELDAYSENGNQSAIEARAARAIKSDQSPIINPSIGDHHQDKQASHQDKQASHQDKQASHQDKQASHQDKQASHQDKQASHMQSQQNQYTSRARQTEQSQASSQQSNAAKAFDTAAANRFNDNEIDSFYQWVSIAARDSGEPIDRYKASIIKKGVLSECFDYYENEIKGKPQASPENKPQASPENSFDENHPFWPLKIIRMKQGNYEKKTGLLSYIEANISSFATMPMSAFTSLDEKFKKVYGTPLPFDPDGNPIKKGKIESQQDIDQESQQKPQTDQQASHQQQQQSLKNQDTDSQSADYQDDQQEKLPFEDYQKSPYARLLELKRIDEDTYSQVLQGVDVDLLTNTEMEEAIKKIEEINDLMNGLMGNDE